MNEVEDFIYHFEGAQRALFLYLHEMFAQELGLTPKIRYKIPFYYDKTWICYLNPIKGDGLELVFLQGQQLSNIQGVLEAKDRKQVAGMRLYDTKDIDKTVIFEILQEALMLQ